MIIFKDCLINTLHITTTRDGKHYMTVWQVESVPGHYSVLLTPPMTAGLQSLAHLNMEEKILQTIKIYMLRYREYNYRMPYLEIPMSLGFSSPLIALCFITLTNSLLLSLPSPSVSNKVNTCWEREILTMEMLDNHPPHPQDDLTGQHEPQSWPRASWCLSL